MVEKIHFLMLVFLYVVAIGMLVFAITIGVFICYSYWGCGISDSVFLYVDYWDVGVSINTFFICCMFRSSRLGRVLSCHSNFFFFFFLWTSGIGNTWVNRYGNKYYRWMLILVSGIYIYTGYIARLLS